jgi:hypothetical protein
MARYLSPEWVQAFDAALGACDLSEVLAEAGRGSLTASEGSFAVAQVVTDLPDDLGWPAGPVRTVLSADHGTIRLRADPEGSQAADVTMVLGYGDALAIATGELDPADALAAGRVRVRGELAVLVAGQAVLAAATTQLGGTPAALSEPP